MTWDSPLCRNDERRPSVPTPPSRFFCPPDAEHEGVGSPVKEEGMKNAFVGITIGLALLGQARAEDKPPPPPKPAAELARLKPLAGSWSCQGASPAGAMGPGSPEMKY